MDKKWILSSAILLATSQLQAQGAKPKPADPIGKCFGVVGKNQGDCGGKNPASGQTWGCSGQNPTADLGYKEMKKSDCEATPKHKDAKTKKFESY
jgi:hypothetical protein